MGTAATFAFRKELLKISSYDETACLAEEKKFLKDYTIPFVQLDPLKTILVFSHNHNSFDKKRLLINADQRYCKLTSKTVSMFIKDKDLKEFYMNKIEDLLKDYEPGRPEHKPDVTNLDSWSNTAPLEVQEVCSLMVMEDPRNIEPDISYWDEAGKARFQAISTWSNSKKCDGTCE